MPAETIRIRGQVQGVGFRPFVWRLARAHGVVGDVRNDAEGVLIRAVGARLDAFAAALKTEKPPLARIDRIERSPLMEAPPFDAFSIVETGGGAARTAVTPDAGTCAACAAEIADPTERRFGYAFANCTQCGPRFSIVETIPYDRAATTMRVFAMCAACRAEYEDPEDRRFHAQPIACPACGPRLWLETDGREIAGDPITQALARLRSGEILAIKGIGGFHLACDALDEAAVARLRRLKRRPGKPFALMAPLETITRYAAVSPDERKALEDPAAPILLLGPPLRAAAPSAPLAPSIAPGLDRIGWMTPYAPVHHLLFAELDRPLVMTSGNAAGAPQEIDNDGARQRLSGYCDAFLTHDRPIARRLDDSVARVFRGARQVLRRARGFAPATLELPAGFAAAPPILATGGELKAALCLSREGTAVLTHHLGDLEDARAYDEYEKAATDYAALFDHAPHAVVGDLHPDSRAARFAEETAARLDIPLIRVQHHHAHIASAMAENGWPIDGPPVLGLALDGTGYGADGTIWGGEILRCDYRSARRVGYLRPTPLPGGEAAARAPWRCLVAQLAAAFGSWADAERACAGTAIEPRLADKPVQTLLRMTEQGLNAPMSSSAGRLFDAVAAALGIAFEAQSYEGETGMRLEALARRAPRDGRRNDLYLFELREENGAWIIDPAPVWAALLGDLRAKERIDRIARRFHDGLASALMRVVERTLDGVGAIALSGGVMGNALLVDRLFEERSRAERVRLCGAIGRDEWGFGRRPAHPAFLLQRQAPFSDGGLALGQAAIGAAQLL